MKQRLSRDTYARIQDGLRARMAAQGFDGLLVDDHHHVAYLSGFFHFPNERPAAIWLTADACILLVPALEADHAEKQGTAADFVVYPEYPGIEDAFSILLNKLNPTGRIAYSPATPAGRVEKFKTFAPNATWIMSEIVEDARLIKFPEEIVLHREAARISDAMVEAGIKLITDALASGAPLPSEAELARHVTGFGTRTMYAEHEDVVVGQMLAGGLVYTGKNAAFPHGLPSAEQVKPGETFILSLGCAVGGRFAESERTFVMGQPSDEQRRYFEVATEAQATGVEALTAGRACSEANRICLDVIKQAGMGQFLRHRMGHGIGIWLHEAPWIADGDDSPLRSGMIVSCEPGLYIPGHGGYRISDTVLITETGPERLTKRPRTIDESIIG